MWRMTQISSSRRRFWKTWWPAKRTEHIVAAHRTQLNVYKARRTMKEGEFGWERMFERNKAQVQHTWYLEMHMCAHHISTLNRTPD